MTRLEKFLTKDSVRQQPTIIFDYDRTIAKIPIDWARHRLLVKDFLESKFGFLNLREGARVDEMEAAVIGTNPSDASWILSYRGKLEDGVEGMHEPNLEIIGMIRRLYQYGHRNMILLSNNLHRTVQSGLNELEITHMFRVILGVDDTMLPKPHAELTQHLNKKFGITSAGTVVIGDSPSTDGEFARRSGYEFIQVSY